MGILQTSFTCPNNHSFIANAKLRARCPECGNLARKDFTAKPEQPHASTKPIDGPVLLRQGKSMPKRVSKPVAKTIAKRATEAPHTIASRARAVNRAPAKVSGGTVKMHTGVPKGTLPKVKKAPGKTAVARHVQGEQHRGSYMDDMIARSGFGR